MKTGWKLWWGWIAFLAIGSVIAGQRDERTAQPTSRALQWSSNSQPSEGRIKWSSDPQPSSAGRIKWSSDYQPQAVYVPPVTSCAENGSCYGNYSYDTGRPKTVHVEGYYRSDGTYVRGHYRSAPR